MDIQNRITEVRKIRLGDIQPNDHNPRKHPDEQRAAYRGILSAIGWAGVPLVYNSERQGGLTFLDGHMRQDESPDLEADIAVTDLTDDEADLFMLTYDPIGALAQMDGAEIEKLVASSKAIENAGYNVDEVLDTFGYIPGEKKYQDFSDLDKELDELTGYEEVSITITIASMHLDDVTDWLANGESRTAPGLGKGVLKHMGIL